MQKYVVLTWNWLATCKDACKTEYVDFFIQIPNKENAILLWKVSFLHKNLNTSQLERNGSMIFVENFERRKRKGKNEDSRENVPKRLYAVRCLRNALCFT